MKEKNKTKKNKGRKEEIGDASYSESARAK